MIGSGVKKRLDQVAPLLAGNVLIDLIYITLFRWFEIEAKRSKRSEYHE